MAHLDQHKLLSDRQHAFRKKHSCETQLTTVINEWAKILDNKGQVDTFILDFGKAFNTFPHELLKSKLFSYATLKLILHSSSLKCTNARTRNIYADIFEKILIGGLEVSFSI